MTDDGHLAFRGWGARTGFADPASPAGGVGPGFSVSPNPRADSWLPSQAPHPQSTKANSFCYQTRLPGLILERRVRAVEAALKRAKFYAYDAIKQAAGEGAEEALRGLIPGIVELIAFVVGVTALGAVFGAVLGAVLGAAAGGIGAVPGALIGAEIVGQAAFRLALFLLEKLGLPILAAYVGYGLGQALAMAAQAVKTAWRAPDDPRTQAFMIDKAGHGLADAVGLVVRGIVQGAVQFLLVKGVAGAAARVPALVAALRESKLGAAFAEWIARDWERLLRDPKLKDELPTPKQGSGGGSGPQRATKVLREPETKSQSAPRRQATPEQEPQEQGQLKKPPESKPPKTLGPKKVASGDPSRKGTLTFEQDAHDYAARSSNAKKDLDKLLKTSDNLTDQGFDVHVYGENEIHPGDLAVSGPGIGGEKIAAQSKMLESGQVNAVRDNLRKATKQAGDGVSVIDGSKVGLSPETFEEGFNKFWSNAQNRKGPGSSGTIIAIFGDGSTAVYKFP